MTGYWYQEADHHTGFNPYRALLSKLKHYLPDAGNEFVQKRNLSTNMKLKLWGFFFLIVLCVVMCSMVCLKYCTGGCLGLCNIHSFKPILNNISLQNRSDLQISPTNRHLPGCIVIGVRKSGTRALLRYLSMHTDIVTANNEMHYFENDDEYSKGLEYYRNKMPKSLDHQIIIEKTPSYFIERLVPERIYRMNSSILLLLIVRDPITRLLSDYTQLRQKAIRKEKTVFTFESEVLDSNGHVNTHYQPILTSIYYIYFSRWLEFFPRKQIHIVDGENFIKNPYKELNDVETFLGLEHQITQNMFYFNNTKGFYCINDGNMSSCLGETKGRKHPDIDPEVEEKLRIFYEKKNKLFFRLTNRTFDWL